MVAALPGVRDVSLICFGFIFFFALAGSEHDKPLRLRACRAEMHVRCAVEIYSGRLRLRCGNMVGGEFGEQNLLI